jgi:hypothetical protein
MGRLPKKELVKRIFTMERDRGVLAVLPYEIHAIRDVAFRAKATKTDDKAAIQSILKRNACDGCDTDLLIQHLFSTCSVTLNFHPDRLVNNGRTIIENMIDKGQYLSQFVTGTTNGGRTAFLGGERDIWERNMFRGAYHIGEDTFIHRPKYGALNIHHYLDGASPRFGSCYFSINSHAIGRCTFAFGDSSSNPQALGTRDAFYAVLRALLKDAEDTGRLLNKEGFTVSKAAEYIASLHKDDMGWLGKNLDHCIETHIHGDVSLRSDIDSLYLDESFRHTDIHKQAEELCGKYQIGLFWIPERGIKVSSIGDEFRGPAIPLLAKRIASHFQLSDGLINAEIIGRASRFTSLHPDAWSDIGNEQELFQYLKQLWHTVAYFG